MVPWDSQSRELWANKYATGEFLFNEGGATHYVVKGSGPLVILLHGFFFDHNLWCKNIDVLAQNFTVYAVDFFGFGFSSRSPTRFTYEMYANQLLNFMAALGIRSASIIGQSLGAGVGIYFAAKHPAMLERLILVGSAGLPAPESLVAKFFKLPGVGEILLKLPVNTLRKKMLEDIFVCCPKTITADLFEYLTLHHKISGTIAVMLSIMRSGVVDKLENEIAELGKSSVPTLVVWGRQDKAIPLAVGCDLHGLLPGSEMAVVDKAGHLPNLEQADEFNSIVTRFLLEA